MKLLIVSNNPDRASFRQRIGVYLDILRDSGILCEVVKLPRNFLSRYRLFKRIVEFDGVFLHKKKLNFVDAFWLGRYNRKIIYDFDDAVMYSPEKPDRNSQSRFRSFCRTVLLADVVIAGNSYLADHAGKFNPNVQVLPTGLNTEEYVIQTVSKNNNKIRLVWIGSKSTLYYLAEIKPALEKIGSHFGNVVLRIISDEFFDLQNMLVEKRQWSKETEAVDLITSDIGLAPLPDNRFTRGKCGFKILQYAAASLPVVASPTGVNSNYVHNKITGLLATNIEQWVDKITQLIEDTALRKQMGIAGRKYAENFDTNIIGSKLSKLIAECLQGRTG